MKTLLTCLFSVLTLFALSPSARGQTRFSQNFAREMQQFRNACKNKPCRDGYRETRIYQKGFPSRVGAGLLANLEAQADERAQIWGDTILEGDYVAAGNTRLDQIFVVQKGRDVIAYRIVYSERAWDTSNCSYDPGDRGSLENCTPGRISEASFIAPSLDDNAADEENYATFTPN